MWGRYPPIDTSPHRLINAQIIFILNKCKYYHKLNNTSTDHLTSGRGSAVSTSVSTAGSLLCTDTADNGFVMLGFLNSFTAAKQRYIKKKTWKEIWIIPHKNYVCVVLRRDNISSTQIALLLVIIIGAKLKNRFQTFWFYIYLIIVNLFKNLNHKERS
jgi:hypothetical protein